LEKKLLIWNDNDKKIEFFYKIRKYVKRLDRFIEIIRNSSIDSNKYFMIIFYDILLLDDTVYIREFYNRQRRLFESLIQRIPDRINIGNREIIDFSFFDIPKLFNEIFIRTITGRWEEFILKNYDNFYFSFKRIKFFIKLKKDYISDFGNTINFTIIRGYRDARDK
jgi:DNA ligase 4